MHSSPLARAVPYPQTSSFPISVIMKQPHAVRFSNYTPISQCAHKKKMLPSSSKIAIIGAGSVGGAIANSLLLGKVVAEVILVDIDPAICHAQVQDLSDAEFLSNVRIKQGHHRDAGQCDIIIVSSGAKQRPGDTRLDLIGRNVKMLEQVLDAMQPIRADAILVLVGNPVDVLTRFAQQLSGLPKGQVFGSGTFLDSVRLRGTLAQRLKVRGDLLIRW
jgi:L-lactate dehydrogenase